MGHVTHHAIVVTSFDERDINAARDTAISILGLSVSPIVESPVNGYHTFLVGDPQPIGYTDDPSVVAEFNRRCEQNPYAFWQTIEAKPIQMEDLPR